MSKDFAPDVAALNAEYERAGNDFERRLGEWLVWVVNEEMAHAGSSSKDCELDRKTGEIILRGYSHDGECNEESIRTVDDLMDARTDRKHNPVEWSSGRWVECGSRRFLPVASFDEEWFFAYQEWSHGRVEEDDEDNLFDAVTEAGLSEEYWKERFREMTLPEVLVRFGTPRQRRRWKRATIQAVHAKPEPDERIRTKIAAQR